MFSARRRRAPSHVGGCPGLVKEYQALGVEIELLLEPSPALIYDVGPVLLAPWLSFCACDPVPREEPPLGCDAGADTVSGQHRAQLLQRDVGLPLDAGVDKRGVVLDLR